MRRRDFIQGLGAAMALNAAACRRPEQRAVPLVNPVEYVIPGVSNYYSTLFTLQNIAFPILVETRDEKPVKIEANLLPGRKGAVSDKYMQSALYSLYDPDRFQNASIENKKTGKEEAIDKIIKSLASSSGISAVITDISCSPSSLEMKKQISIANPKIMFFEMNPLDRNYYLQEANKAVLGLDGELLPDLSAADLIITLDSDIFGTDPLAAYYANSWFQSQNFEENRLIAIEAGLSPTGIVADKRFAIHPDKFERLLNDINNLLEQKAVISQNNELYNEISDYFGKNKSIVILGGKQLSIRAHTLIIKINKLLGAFTDGGAYSTKSILPGSEGRKESEKELRDLLTGNKIENLLFLDINPFYFAESTLKNLISKVPINRRFAINFYKDETAENCSVFIPLSHSLESWRDAVSPDGYYVIGQPVINPLNKNSVSKEEFMFLICKNLNISAFQDLNTFYDYLRKSCLGDAPDRMSWENALRRGYFEGKRISATEIKFNQLNSDEKIIDIAPKEELSLIITPSLNIFDGRFANCAWLQELPHPVSKQCWGNSLAMNNRTAVKQGLKEGDIAKIESNGNSLELSVLIIDEIANDVICCESGYGRSAGGNIAKGTGGNINLLFDTSSDTILQVFKIYPTGKTYKIARTQTDFSLTNLKLEKDIFYQPAEIQKKKSSDSNFEYTGNRWAMAIDLKKCTACGACQIACQSENNIPSVGKDEIIRGRNMLWLNIERYTTVIGKERKHVNLPLLCQHCEKAPCENVCPVAATTHSPEGINEMTYNRCIGARFCMVNCPYKIRRFNFKNHAKDIHTPFENILNPDVTVRMQGIAEKCTFCIQRINEARKNARKSGLAIDDTKLQTACQQSCPTGAILFGNINNKESAISKKLSCTQYFKLLEELNTQPSISYIGLNRNADTERAAK